MIDLIRFAPKEFKEHLSVLDNMVEFNKARESCKLGKSICLQNYVITGNDGVGKSSAANAIYKRVIRLSDIKSYIEKDAATLFEPSDGFASSLKGECADNSLLHIKNAEKLAMSGHINPNTGIEELCNRMREMKNSVVVLSGNRNLLVELVKGNEKAKELFPNFFHFEDLSPEAMFQYMQDYANEKNYMFDPATEEPLKDYLFQIYKLRGSNFRNALFLQELFDREIVPRMSERIVKQDIPNKQKNLCTILVEDMPDIKTTDTNEAIAKLNSLVGLDEVKKQILDHTALVKLNRLRAGKGMFNKMPPMHMVFTGNPGTGKTTIAKYIGEIYHSIGVLSSGHVVVADRAKLVGEYIGVTEMNTLRAINNARGGVLFIDEAYSLFTETKEKKDYGMRVIETLLTYMGTDDTDMIVILAGYTEEMQKMLDSNPGLRSRFSYIFHFEDYTPEQLMQIAKVVIKREHYSITTDAERKLAKYVINAYDHKDVHFGNARFITRLITTQIIPSLSRRILAKPADEISMEEMTTIEECDIPDIVAVGMKPRELDETILTESLAKLNNLTGLQNAKHALNDYVAISRLRHEQGTLKIAPQTLYWDFIGKTGTGKSNVAEILGKLLLGLGILKRGHTVCVNAEELTGSDSYQILERAIKEARDGVMFLDMDAPNIGDLYITHLKMWIFNKLRELQQTTALIFAQVEASEDIIAKNLATNGIAAYGNTIVFNDFTKGELVEILIYLLKNEYQLDIMPDAKTKIQKYIESAKARETKASPVNARTILHLAQTIAHITQLRVATTKGEQAVTLQDVSLFKWNNNVGKVGFV